MANARTLGRVRVVPDQEQEACTVCCPPVSCVVTLSHSTSGLLLSWSMPTVSHTLAAGSTSPAMEASKSSITPDLPSPLPPSPAPATDMRRTTLPVIPVLELPREPYHRVSSTRPVLPPAPPPTSPNVVFRSSNTREEARWAPCS